METLQLAGLTDREAIHSHVAENGTHLQRGPLLHPSPHKSLTSLQDAVAALNTIQSNYAIVNAIRTSGRSLNKQAIPEMIEWCRKIGYEVCACP